MSCDPNVLETTSWASGPGPEQTPISAPSVTLFAHVPGGSFHFWGKARRTRLLTGAVMLLRCLTLSLDITRVPACPQR